MFSTLFRSTATTQRKAKPDSQKSKRAAANAGGASAPLKPAARTDHGVSKGSKAKEKGAPVAQTPQKSSKKKNKRQGTDTTGAAVDSEEVRFASKRRRGEQEESMEPVSAKTMLSSASGSMAERLKGSRFRWLNEQLYTSSGAEAKKLFDQDPSLAVAYHEGFRAQAAKWPRNPLDGVIAWLRSEVPAGSTIGDFGCGEARLAAELKSHRVHSFDLVKVNERVTPCNLADVPLEDGSLDVAVFCLALMGTDWPMFLEEAHRCLKPKGLCHIVEVESRFSDVNAVIRRIESIGFRKIRFDPGSFFVELRFQRAGGVSCGAGSVGTNSDTRVGNRGKRKAKSKDRTADASLLSGCIYRRR